MSDAAPAEGVEERVAQASALRRLWSTLGPFVVLIAIVGVFSLLVGPRFLSPLNLRNALTQMTIVAVGAIGMTLIMVSGGIDLSCGSAIVLSSVGAAALLEHAAGPWWAAAAAIVIGASVGLANGMLICSLRLQPFIVTLGTLGMMRGFAKDVADEQTINFAPTWIDALMRPTPRAGDPAWQRFAAIAPGAWIAVVAALAMAFLMRRTVFGRRVYAIGSNEAAARLCGVHVDRLKVVVYVLGGACFGLAGLLLTSRLHQGDPTSSQGIELDIIAAVVIGGASLTGGVGTVLGSLVGAAMMALLRNGANQMGWRASRQEEIIGAVIIVAAAIDTWRQGRLTPREVGRILREIVVGR